MTELPPPYIFGLPDRFTEWRRSQQEAVLAVTDSEKDVIVQAQPTGAGKSLCYIAAAVITGKRTLILTSSKALQDQLYTDFGTKPGAVLIKGRNAYPCAYWNNKYNCDWCVIFFGVKCPIAQQCQYLKAVETARKSSLVISNYAFWLANKPREKLTTVGLVIDPEKIGTFDMIVCDEGHNISNCICDALGVEITKKRCGHAHVDYPQSEGEIASWARSVAGSIQDHLIKTAAGSGDISDKLTQTRFRLQQDLVKMDAIHDDAVVEWTPEKFSVDPLWPGDYIHDYLIRETPLTLIVSATLTPTMIKMLNIEDFSFLSYRSHFPLERRPFYHVKFPPVRVDFRMSGRAKEVMITKVDQIIRARTDRKGIIHSVSYARGTFLYEHSQFRCQLITHEPGEAGDAIKCFKQSKQPVTLISPAVTTGYDFPYDQCEYQVMLKVPFPDQRKIVDKKRNEINPEFGLTQAMLTLTQAAGRGNRALDDQCESFIVDDHFSWFFYKYKHLAPQSFAETVSSMAVVPKPLPKL